MVKLWEEFQKMREESNRGYILLDGYAWDENGLVIRLHTIKNEFYVSNYAVHFPVDVEAFKVEFAVGAHILERESQYMHQCEMGERYFLCFITDESAMIEQVIQLDKNYKCIGENEEYVNTIPYLDYIIDTEDFWIEVVSSVPPTIEFLGMEEIE